MSRALVQLYEAREVFPTEADARAAVQEAKRTLDEPKFHPFRDLGGGVTFNTVRQAEGAWYALARRIRTHQLIGYVGHTWDDGDDVPGGCGGTNDAEDPTWF